MAESMKGLHRTCRCAEVTKEMTGSRVTLMGWVQKARNKGGLVFVDLRDRSGIMQVIFENGSIDEEGFDKPTFPFLALTISGGHTQIVKVNSFFDLEIIGETTDDAVGEAFDKSAKILIDAKGFNYVGNGDLDKSKAMHFRYTDIIKNLFIEGNPAGIKALLNIQNMIENELRLPLVPVSTPTYLQLKEQVNEVYR